MAILFHSGNERIDLKNVSNNTLERAIASPLLDNLTVAEEGNQTPFTEIGIGKPLSVQIHTVYGGDLPNSLFNRTQDILVVSGVKAVQTYDAVAKGINMLHPRLGDNQYAEFGAFQPGSAISYYTPSLTNDAMSLSFEMIADSFDDSTFTKIGNLMSSASGLPVFAPAATYLIAGKVVTQMISELGKSFLESSPGLTDTLDLRFDIAGFPRFKAGFYTVINDSQISEFSNFEAKVINGPDGNKVRMVNTEGKIYEGDAPYIIVGIDGRKRSNLENFAPHLASAAILEKYYPKSDSFAVVTDQLSMAMNLYNDFKFNTKADEIKTHYQSKSSEYQQSEAGLALIELYDAYRNNIQQDEFKLGDINS